MDQSSCAEHVNVKVGIISFRMPQPPKLEKDFFQLGRHSTRAYSVMERWEEEWEGERSEHIMNDQVNDHKCIQDLGGQQQGGLGGK